MYYPELFLFAIKVDTFMPESELLEVFENRMREVHIYQLFHKCFP